jgi:hypothetical protein
MTYNPNWSTGGGGASSQVRYIQNATVSNSTGAWTTLLGDGGNPANVFGSVVVAAGDLAEGASVDAHFKGNYVYGGTPGSQFQLDFLGSLLVSPALSQSVDWQIRFNGSVKLIGGVKNLVGVLTRMVEPAATPSIEMGTFSAVSVASGLTMTLLGNIITVAGGSIECRYADLRVGSV